MPRFRREIPLSNTDFSRLQIAFLAAYGLMYAGGGALIDWLGTRRGFVLIMIWWSLACAGHGLAARFRIARLQPVPARRRRRRRLPGRDQGGGRMVSRPRALDRDGHDQRRHRDRRRDCAAAPRRDHPHRQLALGLRRLRRGRSGVDGLVGARVPPAGAASRAVAGRARDDRRGVADAEAAIGPGDAVGVAADACARSGAGAGEVPDRRRVVLLPVLAAEVSLRRARLRREAGRLLRVDSLRRGRRRQPDRRLVLELAARRAAARSTPRARSRSA